jgi:hypothetical protein
MRVQSQHLAALLYSMAVLTACAPQGRRDFTPPRSTALDVISENDIATSRGTNALEVVERVRPMYLASNLDLAPTAQRQVYLNGIKLGSVGELRWIPASEVKEIRFVRAIDGGAYGVGGSGGAILVRSKSGR